MRWLLALTVAAAIIAAGVIPKRSLAVTRLGEYLGSREEPLGETAVSQARRRTGPSIPWMLGGAFLGVLASQGDLFIAGAGRSLPALVIVGGVGGWFVYSARESTAQENRMRRMRFEIPVVADSIAMQVVSGESVATALASVCATTKGAVSDDLAAVLERTQAETSLPDALLAAASEAPHVDVRRLYETLAHAHSVGGRLNESLCELAIDFRASLERDLTAEGGRRAITSYGPVIALMVPTALMFLLYPTLLGLRSLSGGP